ncbi:MAG: hypothetical protein R6W31_14360, partial [Bacteroidales bacterium]
MKTLREGEIDVTSYQCKVRSELSARLKENPPDLIMADFDSPQKLRGIVEQEMKDCFSEVPLIFLVGDMKKFRENGKIRAEVWDYIFKDRLFTLIPSVYSSQRYSRLFRQERETMRALSESQEHFRALADNSQDVIMRFDLQYGALCRFRSRTARDLGRLPACPASLGGAGNVRFQPAGRFLAAWRRGQGIRGFSRGQRVREPGDLRDRPGGHHPFELHHGSRSGPAPAGLPG